MTMFGRVFGAVPLAGMMLLASCGGGGDTAGPQDQQASPGIAVGEPSPNAGALVTTQFVARAQEESCADTRNRLFVIDNKQVFWDRSGNCTDNAYARRLFGATPEALLCASSDSIAGPRTSCSDDKARAMFDIIVKNLDQADLGLGSAHKVEAVPFLPKDGTGIMFSSLVEHAFSGVHSARNVVIKDEAAWARLWAEHASGNTPAPALPKVDFSKNMLLGVFAGEKGSGCRQVGVIKVAVSGGKIAVEYEERDLSMVALCIQAISAPANVVVVPRSDAEVVFAKVTPEHLAFQNVDQSTRSQIRGPQNVVIKDAATFSALWTAHTGNTVPEPVIDFQRHMVLGSFLGKRMNGCYSTDIMNVYRTGQKITVQRVDWEPGEGLVCTLAIVSPAHLVKIERSEDPVEFTSQIQTLK
jgi:hypothetical protein